MPFTYLVVMVFLQVLALSSPLAAAAAAVPRAEPQVTVTDSLVALAVAQDRFLIRAQAALVPLARAMQVEPTTPAAN